MANNLTSKDKRLILKALWHSMEYRRWYLDCIAGCDDPEYNKQRSEELKHIQECKDLMNKLNGVSPK